MKNVYMFVSQLIDRKRFRKETTTFVQKPSGMRLIKNLLSNYFLKVLHKMCSLSHFVKLCFKLCIETI